MPHKPYDEKAQCEELDKLIREQKRDDTDAVDESQNKVIFDEDADPEEDDDVETDVASTES